MKIEQIYTGCLAHAAYYLESNGEVAIFDPLREVQPYIDRALKDHANIKYVFETHFHADFVSGHLDLAQKTGAQIVYGPTAKPNFEAIVATDHQEFKVGNYTVRVIHTPGHTMESTVYLLIDENGKEHGIITGDTLFIGDVGRPDLAQHVIAELTQDKLAGYLYDSLRNKIMPLSDDLIVYPNHGAGSACGKNMSKETTDTLGHQKQTNYALNPALTKEEFIPLLLEGLTPPPGYFPSNVLMNIQGYTSFDEVLHKGMKGYDANEFEVIAEETGALVIDTRDAAEFCKGFVPRSINIGIKGDFAPWLGTLVVDVKQPILVVTEKGKEEEVITRMSRVGFDHVVGHLKGGIDTWIESGKEIDHVERISSEEFKEQFVPGQSKVLDLRKEGEYAAEHLQDAYNRPLAYINDWIKEINTNEHFYIHCAAGYRSMIAASILQSRGYRNFSEIEGGFNAIKQTNVPMTDFICQSKVMAV